MCKQVRLSKILSSLAIGLIFSGSYALASKPRSIQIVEESLPESSVVVRAIDLDQKDKVQDWLRAGHSPLTRIENKLKEQLLDRAASQGSVEVFNVLLSEIDRGHYSAKLTDSRGTPLLVGLASLAMPGQAQASRYERMIEALLRFSSSTVNESDRAYIGDGRTALHQAAANGNVQVIRTLIAHGAQVNAKNSSGETPLHLAARFGHVDAVQYLLYSGANLHQKTNYTKATALMAAAEMGHASVIRMLMAAGANKNEKDTFGKTPPERYKDYTAGYYKRLELAKQKP